MRLVQPWKARRPVGRRASAVARRRRGELRGKVAVVTGASSGLGREIAVQLAARGSRVVVAARRKHELERTVAACRAEGGDALAVPTDVTREHEVEALARTAHEYGGGKLDLWINNAGVTLFAPLEEGPFEQHRMVIETNLFGAIYGARAVLPTFKRQRRGVLINVGSVLSEIGQPFVPAYVISKFGLRGLSEALRVELADERDIHVCTVMPYVIDTPHFESAASRVGRKARAMPPMQSPEKVARAIVGLALRPRRTRYVPRIAFAGLLVHAAVPRTCERLLLHALRRFHFAHEGEPVTEGNLREPAAKPSSVHGERPPVLSTPRLLLWTAGEWLRMRTPSGRRSEPAWPAPARP